MRGALGVEAQAMLETALHAGDGSAHLTLADLRVEPGVTLFDLIVSSRGLGGRIACALEPEWFTTFVTQLERMYDSLSGSAELRYRYEETHVLLEIHRQGQVLVSGLLADHVPPGQRLEFGFLSDQSCLPSFMRPLLEFHRAMES
jgi:hypothetical protein